ncbi:putative E3 ubiquitin-protein ligase RING2 [Hypsibius exemplaris]|uniref:RING-type E3 ubiquitin transferase n=1 Tax=Hypsibius exemplaris TaxID=2072580 RepID=A0A1W0WRZ2_HYPEX|nr:putative E3 ubiquitin-protein ligase RING2 [Hypsibius exemplaris]
MSTKRNIWELTPYELHRKPQTIPDDDQEIRVTQRFLESELSCAICLDILRNTRTTKECLHRFCDECISQALRSGNKECPNCRAHLASMRSLRPDPIFDAIIGTIFPNRAELDRQQSQLLAQLAESSDRHAMLSSIEAGKRHQAQSKGRGPRKSKGGSGHQQDDEFSSSKAPSVSTTTSEAGSARGPDELRDASETADHGGEDNPVGGMVGLEIIPYKEKMKGQNGDIARKWKRRYVKVKNCATVAHLSRFILSRLMVERPSYTPKVNVESLDLRQLTVYAKVGRKDFQLMDPHLTLKEVRANHSRGRSYVTLAFAITGTLKF